jgi:hypothetical protein
LDEIFNDLLILGSKFFYLPWLLFGGAGKQWYTAQVHIFSWAKMFSEY